jgi:diaminohydroxyphosphoribosylaminopyrimidine deaminase/5-amino-6-(5-phosphoribosylamino)uracil reductase
VACGIGTALADDPLLTARVEGVSRQPARVVFDSEARLPLTSKLVQTAPEIPLYVICSRAAGRTATEALTAAGAEVVVVRGDTDAARVADGLRELGERDIQSLLLEGGPHLAGSFFDASEVDEARVFVAPILAGGSRSRPALEGQGVELIGDAPRAISQTVETIDGDVLIEARFREW